MLKEQSRRIKIFWALTLGFCVSLVLNLIPWLRGDVPGLSDNQKWVWPYSAPRWLWVIPCILGLAVYVIGALHLLDRESESDRRYPRRLILWAFGGAVLLPLLLMTLEGRPLFLLFTRSASTVIGGYQFSTNMITDLGDTLRNWPQFVVDYRKIVPLGGIALSPPGLAALYYGATKALEAVPPLASTFDALVRPLQCQNFNMNLWTDAQMASAWFQMAMPLWAALAVAPLYALGAAMFDRRVARWAVVLWPLVPGMDIFTPRFNVWYPLIALVIMVILWRGLTRPGWRSGLWTVGLAGFLLSVGLFMNLSLMPLGLLSGLIMLGLWFFGPTPWTRGNITRLAANLVIFGIGCASVGVIYTVLSGVSIITVMQQGFAYHSILDRPYAPWLVLHTYDVFLWIGLPLSILAVWRLLRIRRPVRPADVLSGAMGLTLVIMVLSGTARGETGRVWLFFAGFWLLMAADMLIRLPAPERTALVVMQAMVVFSMAAVLRANFTELTVVPWPPAPAQGATFATNVRFVQGTDAVTLSGLSVDRTPTNITLHLYWTSDAYVRRPYILTLVPVPPDKSARPSQNWVPVNQNYPPACWLPKQTFVDDVTVPLGDKPQSSDWLFSLSIIDMFTRQPMVVDGQGTTQYGIGPVNVPASAGN